MKRLNQKGVAVIYIIIGVILLLGIAAFTYTWLKSKDDATKQTNSSPATEAVETKEEIPTSNEKINTDITKLENPIMLTKVTDLEKLPAVTPDSFKSYMKTVLQDNNPDKLNCISAYSVHNISQVNISGGIGSVASDTGVTSDSCGGGAAMFWYLKDSKWDKIGTQAMIPCSAIKLTTLYSEFVETCHGEQPDYTELPNPNGSIKDAAL